MNSEEFVSAIKNVVEINAIDNVIKNISQLSGRKIDYRYKYLFEWYNGLDEESKECIKQIIKESVSTTLFGFFCVLDGVRAIESNPDKGTLELFFVKEGKKSLLNDFDKDFLHDIYNGL